MLAGKTKSRKIFDIYEILFETYGPQGWWPLLTRAGKHGFDPKGYHKKLYSYPKTTDQRFEIALGAILTQNTAWTNVERAIVNLVRENIVSPLAIAHHPVDELKDLVRSCGYFNQKTKKLLMLASYFITKDFGKNSDAPSREELLGLWGIGEETADSILLYAFGMPSFVVDSYTKRIFSRLGFFEQNAKYADVQRLFTENLPQDTIVYNEMHALIVEHAKMHCRKKHACDGCVLCDGCRGRL
jgi:endonuclease-3 related protein